MNFQLENTPLKNETLKDPDEKLHFTVFSLSDYSLITAYALQEEEVLSNSMIGLIR